MKLHRSKGIADIKNTTTVRTGPKNYGNISYLNTGTKIIEQHVIVCCQQHSFDILQSKTAYAKASFLTLSAQCLEPKGLAENLEDLELSLSVRLSC